MPLHRERVHVMHVLRHVLIENPENYRRSPPAIRVLRPMFGRGLFLSNGDDWRQSDGAGPRVSAGQAAYDHASARVILFGMADGGGAPETWAWKRLSATFSVKG